MKGILRVWLRKRAATPQNMPYYEVSGLGFMVWGLGLGFGVW